VDDAALVAQVRAALARVPEMPANVKVEAVGGVVTMSAVVKDAEVARQGHAAVRRIPGIRKIDDRLVSGHMLSWD